MVPKCGLLPCWLARLSSKIRGGGYSKIYGFFGIRNHAPRNGQKYLKLSKSSLGQVKLSVEGQYITQARFLDFLEGLFSDSATVGCAPPPHPKTRAHLCQEFKIQKQRSLFLILTYWFHFSRVLLLFWQIITTLQAQDKCISWENQAYLHISMKGYSGKVQKFSESFYIAFRY